MTVSVVISRTSVSVVPSGSASATLVAHRERTGWAASHIECRPREEWLENLAERVFSRFLFFAFSKQWKNKSKVKTSLEKNYSIVLYKGRTLHMLPVAEVSHEPRGRFCSCLFATLAQTGDTWGLCW